MDDAPPLYYTESSVYGQSTTQRQKEEEEIMKKRIRSLLALLTALALLLSCVPALAESADAPATLAELFLQPDNDSRPMFRYWLPDAAVTEEQLAKEMQEMQDAGFGGVEIAHVPFSRLLGDLETNGWGTPAMQQALINVFNAANTLEGDFNVDVTINTQWPPALDTIDPNDEAASQELHMAYAKIPADLAMDVPQPERKLYTEALEPFIIVNKFEAATIAKVAEVREDGLTLEFASMQDVSDCVTETGETLPAGIPDENDPECVALYGGAELDMTWWGDRERLADEQPCYAVDLSGVEALQGYAPSEGDELNAGDYVLFCFYRRGTGDTISPATDMASVHSFWGLLGVTGYSYATSGTIIDEFSTLGAQAIIDDWETRILNDELVALMQERAGNFFEDSIETDTATMFWNGETIEKINAATGYDITPYLPLLFASLNGIAADTVDAVDFIEDYDLVNNDSYQNDHLKVWQEWAKERLNYGLRTQSYGRSYIDEGTSAANMDVAEGETLAFTTEYDKFRMLSTSARLAGNSLVSDEALASGAPYSMTYKEALSTLNGEYAAGMNRIIIHGYSYMNTENMGVEGKDDRDQWPGWCTFTSGAGDSWGSRNATWQDIRVFTDYVSRVQAILQNGTARNDVAVLTRPFDHSAESVAHTSLADASNGTETDLSAYSKLLDKGYTYDVYTEGTLNMDACAAVDGVLVPDGSAARAIIVDNMEMVEYDTAAKLLELAQNGLPVIFAGAAPSRSFGSDMYNANAGHDEAAFQAVIDELLAMSNVVQAADMDAVFAALDSFGIAPSAAYDAVNVRTQLREDADGSDYYLVYNGGEAENTVRIAFTGEGAPFRLDPWSGEITPVEVYEKTEDGIVTDVTLAADDLCFIALIQGEDAATYLTSADAPVVATENGFACKVEAPGAYTATDAEGQTLTASVEALPAAPEVSGWSLSLESWGPDAEANRTDLTVSQKTTVEFEDAGLGTWTELAASEEQLAELGVENMQQVSGIGTYAATLTLPEDYDSAHMGYTMEFSHGNGMISQVEVNGTVVPVTNQIAESVDIGAYLQPGENEIRVQYISTMLNRVLYEARDDEQSLFYVFGGDPEDVRKVFDLSANPMFETLLGAVHFVAGDYGLTGVEFTPYAIAELAA